MALTFLLSTEELFQEILSQGTHDDTIQDVVLVEKKPTVKKGDNYMSDLTSVKLSYTCNPEKVQKFAHLIVKEEPITSEATLALVRETDVFNTERVMLEEVVPKIEALVDKKLAPKVYYSSIEPQMIVMEDLTALGFHTKNRKVGFNEQQVGMVLENLADFHAASVLLSEQNLEFCSRFKNGLMNENTSSMFLLLMAKRIGAIGRRFSTWPEENFASISNKLRARARDFTERLKSINQCDEDELKVLNHGDMWLNNIMIRDDDNGDATEACFVDYQMSVWTSPAVDLLYFLSITPEASLKCTHDDIFLEQYLQRLSSTMKKLGCSANAPTLSQLKTSMYKRRALALMGAFVFWPRMLMEAENVESLGDTIAKGTSMVDPLDNQHALNVITKILPIFNERGYLD